MKTLIAVPCMDQLDVAFVESLTQMRTGGNAAIQFVAGSLVYDARNKLAQIAVENGFDAVLWLDSDMTFDQDFLERMQKTLEESGADIVTALYFGRRPPYKPLVYSQCDYVFEDNDARIDVKLIDTIPEEPFEAAACGFGGVLMRAEILKTIREQKGLPFSPIYGLGEDLSFCVRARALGKKIVCDPRILMGHSAKLIIGGPDYVARWNALQK
ncbi:MAG: glycosyltransferase [Firmicutes bacterium]|nr:glycosyltransferase [Bacillota bacterium]